MFILYQQDLLGIGSDDALARAGGPALDAYTSELVYGVAQYRTEIDAILEKCVEGWTVERLGVLERAILRLAVYELLWEPEVPPAIVIDEAVGAAKRFCSDEASSLVNGVLGAVADTAERDLDPVARPQSATAAGNPAVGQETA